MEIENQTQLGRPIEQNVEEFKQVANIDNQDQSRNKKIILSVLLIAFLGIGIAMIAYLIGSNPNGSEDSPEEIQEPDSYAESPDSYPDSSPVATVNTFDLYLRKFPESSDDFTYVEAVNRSTTRVDAAEFLIEEYFKGPTEEESILGFETAFSVSENPLMFEGESNCEGQDYAFAIENQVAVLRFCKTLPTRDDFGIYVKLPLRTTLEQFSTIDKVVFLNPDGTCYNDLSGINSCLIGVEYNSLMNKQVYTTANL